MIPAPRTVGFHLPPVCSLTVPGIRQSTVPKGNLLAWREHPVPLSDVSNFKIIAGWGLALWKNTWFVFMKFQVQSPVPKIKITLGTLWVWVQSCLESQVLNSACHLSNPRSLITPWSSTISSPTEPSFTFRVLVSANTHRNNDNWT